MEYLDRVYGKIKITEPVILELINSYPLQRQKKIDQSGYRPLWVKPSTKMGRFDHSRFAHSLGVFALLHQYMASLEEQIAGLIHDVSHAAFSHCIDYALAAGSEKTHSHQDNIFEGFVKKTEIPQILKKHGFDIEYVLNDRNFPLKEKELPDLCADRIDYSLREAVIFGELKEKEKTYLLDNLISEKNYWIFKDLASAKRYANLFLRLNRVYFAGLQSAVMFRTVGDCLRYALEKRYISKNDLYTTDKIVIEKIKEYLIKDKKLKFYFDRMNNKVGVVNDPKNYNASVFCKSRVVDPLFKQGKKLKRLSKADAGWKKVIEQEKTPKQYFLKFEK